RRIRQRRAVCGNQRLLPRRLQRTFPLMSDVHPATGQPIGLPVDAQPAQRPGTVTLDGRYRRVERLDPARPRHALWEVVRGHDKIWTYMAYGLFPDETAFSDWLAARVDLADPYYYAIVDPSGRAVGLATLMSIRPDMRVVEVGNILLSPVLQRTPLAT